MNSATKRQNPLRRVRQAGKRGCCAIAVMAKASSAGRTKTRLVPPLTLEQAAELNTAFIADVADNLALAARQADIDRASFTEEAHRLSAIAEDAESRLAKVNAELDELRSPFAELSDTVVAVPTEQLRLARAQFDFLADGFAKNGDVISQTICEIGRCAIEQALAGNKPAK